MSDSTRRGPWSWLTDLAIALLVTTGYGSPVATLVTSALFALCAGIGGSHHQTVGAILYGVAALGLLTGWVVATIKAWQHIRDRGRGGYLVAVHVLALVLLPAWGLWLNFAMLHDTCRTSSCEVGPVMFRVLGARGIVGLLAAHALTALAFVVSRRRPARLPGLVEPLVHASIVAGLGLHALLAVQLADLLWGLLAFPLTLPLVAPFVTLALYAHELAARLRRRGADALASAPAPPDAVYRTSPARDVPSTADAPAHRPTLLAALAGAPALAGAYAVVMAAVHHRPAAALDVFTQTCGHALSRLPIVHVPVADCHYLCTVAARGTPSLVRPERVGRRHGQPILVNRQLAVANAFEDLLHARWPRFGRLARATYDRLGMPVSRHITRPWMADVVFVAMKPLEWAFYAALLLLDRGDPEARIDRMYR